MYAITLCEAEVSVVADLRDKSPISHRHTQLLSTLMLFLPRIQQHHCVFCFNYQVHHQWKEKTEIMHCFERV